MTVKKPTKPIMYWRAVLVIYLSTYVFAKVDYTGHQLLGVSPTSEKSAKLLMKLFEDDSLDLDPWLEAAYGMTVPVRVPPASLEKFQTKLAYHHIPYKVLLTNVQRLIDQEAASIYSSRPFIDKSMIRFRRSTSGPSRYIVDETLKVLFNTITTFPNHQMINDWLDSMSELLPEIATTEIIGNSTHHRPLKLIKIGRPRADGKPKKIILVDALIHAREWVTQSTALYMVYQLMRYDGEDPEITTLVDTFDWHILPVLNPDGYEYSHEEDRMWRKTRSYHRNDQPRKRQCIGTDANRNFGYHWKNDMGHCVYFYSGPHPFSEPETVALANYILKNKENVLMYLSLHSPIEKWLTPWGHTKEEPQDNEDIKRVAQAAVRAMTEKHGRSFEAVQIAALYPVFGSSIDWAKGAAGVKYAFAPELRGDQKNIYGGFFIPSNQLVPAGEETWDAVRAAVKEVMKVEHIEAHQKTETISEADLDDLEELVKLLPANGQNVLMAPQNLQAAESVADPVVGTPERMVEVTSGQQDLSPVFLSQERGPTTHLEEADTTTQHRSTQNQGAINLDTRSPKGLDIVHLLDGITGRQQPLPTPVHTVTQEPVIMNLKDGKEPPNDQSEGETQPEEDSEVNTEIPKFTPARVPRTDYY